MLPENQLKISNKVLLAPLFAVLSIWIVFWVEVKFGFNFNEYGIYPKKLFGLRGVVLSPFIHGSVEHLYNNTIPLAVLTAFLFHFYQKVAFKALFWGILLSGLLTWLIGRSSYHIGASGLIYVLASFIFFKGIITKHYRWVALSLIVVFIYGSLIWYIFPIKDGISWEGHLSGFLTGLFLAFLLKVETPEEKRYDWEKEDFNEEEDPFLRQFDKDGNFIEIEEEKEETPKKIRIRYHYKSKEEGDTSS
ncbi:rhomboid family intramembrane serine protease [Flagellimonas allohymeniacidonis]|uniref:Rhomboid family intramembrane serine protease n=1 Tax=Flagellimonas allohymeniacidonis TaxID=2517819 RepID=A0A4Q8QGZ3_9FLAO|nr:rhomboid family intramembrane serine protease [Allomuricauda hymeniacidonis]TAI49852.1 rhomboid family intramembrane serine protease [Allomuricauda hymeniacidonis]